MRFLFGIAIYIAVISSMVVEASINRFVHAEYLRRRWMHSQSATTGKIFHEPPTGVHAAYLRRYRDMQGILEADTPHHEQLVKKNLRHSKPRV